MVGESFHPQCVVVMFCPGAASVRATNPGTPVTRLSRCSAASELEMSRLASSLKSKHGRKTRRIDISTECANSNRDREKASPRP